MIKSKTAFETRCRPALGTLVRVQLDQDDLILFEAAYQAIAEIESTFNFHDADSELSKINREEFSTVSIEFSQLLRRALYLRKVSNLAFSPFIEEQRGEKKFEVSPLEILDRSLVRLEKATVDLGGIAKGLAVDRAAEAILRISPDVSGFVEAGGDVRFFGSVEKRVKIRLGLPPQIIMREFILEHCAIATSAPGVAQEFGESKTHFSNSHWPLGTTAVVLAETCQQADSLTKVALFAEADLLKQISIEEGAEFLFFDQKGNLLT